MQLRAAEFFAAAAPSPRRADRCAVTTRPASVSAQARPAKGHSSVGGNRPMKPTPSRRCRPRATAASRKATSCPIISATSVDFLFLARPYSLGGRCAVTSRQICQIRRLAPSNFEAPDPAADTRSLASRDASASRRPWPGARRFREPRRRWGERHGLIQCIDAGPLPISEFRETLTRVYDSLCEPARQAS